MKSTSKVSSIRLRQVLETIESIASINNQDEKNPVLNDIYRIAHAFTARCKNPHTDWRELQEIIRNKLKDY